MGEKVFFVLAMFVVDISSGWKLLGEYKVEYNIKDSEGKQRLSDGPETVELRMSKISPPKEKLVDEKKWLSSCKDLLDEYGSLNNGVHTLQNKDTLDEYDVYCHMNEIPGCGLGGWTLVMKIDGKKDNFRYESPYWTNKIPYAVEDGLAGLTERQTKLASYWNTPFNKICLGMKFNNVTKWILMEHSAKSLFNVIAGGYFQETFTGRDQWLSLMDSSRLQSNCNKEGFNFYRKYTFGWYGLLYTKMRIGIVGNNENNCYTPDSCIGFGTSVRGCFADVKGTSCGNMGTCGWLNNMNRATFGYILVQ